MKKKIVQLGLALALLHSYAVAQTGPIFDSVSKVPSNLKTQLGPQSLKVQKFTSIGCYDVSNGIFIDCSYDFTIIGLVNPTGDAANNGGHTHDTDIHPLGDLSVIAPLPSGPAKFLAGQTLNDIVVVSHNIPEVSGKIDTVMNLRVPLGWHTVFPQPFDDTHTSWQFRTTIDVGLSGLQSLPLGRPSFIKVRGKDSAHTDAVAFFGTADTLIYLTAIADTFALIAARPLSVNDMSLIEGGLFDWRANPDSKSFSANNVFTQPHILHRTGQSADINREGLRCEENQALLQAVNGIMPAIQGSIFSNRRAPSQGRFLCEANGNIHIDFDVQVPPSPSTFQ